MNKPLSIALSTLLAAALHAQIVSLNPTADSCVSSANPTSNYGGGGALAVSASGLPKGEFDSLFKFDLSSAMSSFDALYGAGNWTVQSIALQLTNSPPNNALFNGFGTGPGGSNVNTAGLFSIRWMQNDTWTEGTGAPSAPTTTGITFATLPTFLSGADEALGTFSFNGATSGNSTFSLFLTSSLFAEVTAGNNVSLLTLPGDAAVAAVLGSRTNALRPSLTVTAVPEPQTAVLALAGMIGLIARRRLRAR